MRLSFRLGLVVLVAATVGCPRDEDVPGPGPDVQSCERIADCNERSCGVLRACVDGLCTRDASLLIPCTDAGR